jgi:hypothetical protein
VVCQLVLSCRVLEGAAALLAGLGLAAAQAKAGAEQRQAGPYMALQHELLLALRPLLLQLLSGPPAYAALLQQPAPLAALAAALGGGRGAEAAAAAAASKDAAARGLASELADVLHGTLAAMRCAAAAWAAR